MAEPRLRRARKARRAHASHRPATAPTVVSLTIAPAAIDVTAGAQTVTATARITDAGSGVKSLELLLTPPSFTGQRFCSTTTLVSGTTADGVWSCTVTVPKDAEAGAWSVRVNAYDAVNNMRAVDGAALTALGAPTTVTVTNGG